MRGFNNEAWVTAVCDDDDVSKALALASALKLSCTNRWIAVVASSVKTSLKSRDALHETFDFVFPLEDDRNQGHLKAEDFAKLCAIWAMHSFGKCVFVAPGMLPIKNCDEIFDHSVKMREDFLFLEDLYTSIFVFKPSLKLSRCLIDALPTYKNGSTGAESFFKIFSRSSTHQGFVSNEKNYLPEKFNKMILNEANHGFNDFRTDFENMSMVNFGKLNPIDLDSTVYQNAQTPLKSILEHWKKIYLEMNEDEKNSGNRRCSSEEKWKKEPIAIVGMSCRYPKANNLDEFWNILANGEDATGTPPEHRWLPEQCVTSEKHAECRKTNAGFLKTPVDEFDSKFFGISPKEALSMDPQHRLLHEVIWEGLEDAAIDPHTLKGSLGSVFLGSWTNDYKDILAQSGNEEFFRVYMSNSISAMTARISHFMGFTGPSIATESGCSSAMVALHLACKSLRQGETNLALAGGVNLLLRPFHRDFMPIVISPDGHCKTFDEGANGFARAEGCGVLVLKRLSDAAKDGDRIWALIRGTGVSQEGTSKSMGTPTVHSESLAMDQALDDANVRPEEISYVEAHGTGTAVGDPLEVSAIANVYHSKKRTKPLIIGSVKANVGHTESCSGITGIMKVVLSMVHEMIPPQRNLTKLNPAIDLEAIPAKIPMEPMKWGKLENIPRLAGVSSFGITGTDAHAIIEESPDLNVWKPNILQEQCSATVGERQWNILKISAKTEQSLDILIERYKKVLEITSDSPSPSLEDICFTANTGRSDFQWRAIITGKSKQEMFQNIKKQKYLKGEISAENSTFTRKICFLFTGQGSQYPGMARNLYETSPVFRMHFDSCGEILKTNYEIDIKNVLWSTSPEASEISRTIYSQTSIFCVEYALLKLWESMGVTPDLVLGHSLGEFAAAVAAGIFSVSDAIKLVAERSLLIDKLPQGKMLVIKADHSTVSSHMSRFGKPMDFAAMNSAEQTVVAGDSSTILEFAEYLKTEQNLKCLVLEATHAFHSRHMDPMLDAYRQVLQTLKKCQKKINQKCVYVSGLRGRVIDSMEEVLDPQYWVDHTRKKVKFMEASKAVAVDCDLFIEIGPQPILSAMTMMNNEDNFLSCLPSLKKNCCSDWEVMLGSLGNLYLLGFNNIDWTGLDIFRSRKKVSVPHYPFIGKKFWPEMTTTETGLSLHPLLGTSLENPTSSRLFQCGINLRSHEYIKDHVIGDHVIFPGAGYLEMCLAVGLYSLSVTSGRPMKIENLCIEAPLELLEDKTRHLHTVVELDSEGDASVKIFQKNCDDATASSSSWLLHSKATFCSVLSEKQKKVEDYFSREDFQKMREGTILDDLFATQIYEKLASLGLQFGPSFRSLDKIWKSETQSKLLANIKVQPDGQQEKYIVHPVVLDAMIQSIMMLRLTSGSNLKKKLHLPIKIGRFVWLGKKITSDLYISVCDPTNTSSTDKCAAVLVNSEGHPLAIMSKVEFIDTTVKAVESVLEHQTNPMPQMWEEVWRPHIGTTQCRANLDLCSNKEFSNLVQPEAEVQVELFSKLEQFCTLSILRALFDLGWAPSQGEFFLETALFEKLQIQPNFRGLFSRYMDFLEMEGLLEKHVEKYWKVTIGPKMSEVDEILNSKELRDTLLNNFQMTPLYMEVGSILSDILRGRVPPESVLFPDSKIYPGLGDFQETYNSTFGVDALLRKSFGEWLEHVISGQRTGERFILRILEIGTGSEPDPRILELLKKFEVEFEYIFGTAAETDVTKSYNQNHNVAFAKLDLDLDPISQGFIPEYFDLISVTSNLSATGLGNDIQRSLCHLRTLLRSNGRLDILGISGVNVPLNYLFGLIGDLGALSSDNFVEICGQCGFGLVESTEIMDGRHSYFSLRKLSECNVGKVKGPDIVDNLIEKTKKKIWLLFDLPGDPLSTYLGSKMGSVAGRNVICVRAGKTYNDDDHLTKGFQIRRKVKNDFLGVMEKIGDMRDSMTLEGIVYCWSLDDLATSQDDLLQPYFYLLQTMYKGGGNPRLITLTRGATNPVQDCELRNIHASTILGVTKSFLNERTEFKGKCFDISSSESEETMFQVFHEIWKLDTELLVSFSSGGYSYVPKLVALKPNLQGLSLPCGTDRFQLTLPETKSIKDLKFTPLEPFGPLGELEVEVQIKASALNFKDVLNVIKPTDEFKSSNSVGFDYAGVIKRIGSKVTRWSVGDRVFGVNYNGTPLPSHTKQHQDNVIPVPDGVTFCEAASLPAVFSTAYHCLVEIAKITQNDTVLIHTASGGVGIVAIQICKNIGCSIICTAGSNRKRNFLMRNLGIQNVFHSRNIQFQDKIMEVTKGQGVTVVLNSLTSEGFKQASLKCCSKGARFIEMSKLNIWTPQEVRDLRPDVFYRVVDLTTLEQPEATRLLQILSKMLTENAIGPIPSVRFDAVRIREALQYLQKAKHIGKVMVMMPEVKQSKNEPMTALFNEQSTYLITGGLGGIGFTVCKWMVQRHGARWVILAGRRCPDSKLLQEIEELNKNEMSKVRCVQLDVSDFEQCMNLLESKISEIGYPLLRGIMHCAGTLHDGLIDNQEWGEFSSTFTTKIQGTLNLHELTKRNLRLEHFVLFSSMAANFGTPCQGNHTAGNLFEDTMAHYRHSLGLPATSVNWGQWGEVGIATEAELHGVRPFSNQQALQGLEFCMRSPQRVQTSVVNIESFLMLNKLIRHCSTYLDEHIWRSCSGAIGEKSQSSQMKSSDFWRHYDAISTEFRDEKYKFVNHQLKSILRNILKLEDSEVIGDDANFQEMGVDSLMFVEMKNYLQALFGDRVTVNASAVRDCDTVGRLAATLVQMIEGDAMSDATVAPPKEEVAALIREDAQLPEHIRAKEGSRAVDVTDVKVVMLTGVTGTLGPYILKELTTGCVSDQLTKVICLVRPHRQISGEERIRRILKERDISGEVDMSKVTVVSGNVALPKLGLEESKWSELIDEVDAVFHCAALVQHVEHYRKKTVATNNDMRAVNNGGTKNILEFVSSGSKLKPLFHCSTMFVASTLDPKTGCMSEQWPDITDYDGVTTLAYQTSKFVCDMLLKEAVLNRGITAKVCRFPLIFGDSRSGRFVLEQNHAMLRYLFIMKSGVMPSNPFPMMLLPVDLCASIGVKIFFDERFPFNQIYNICHDRTQTDQDFVQVAKRLGHHVNIVEFSEFATKVIDSTEEDSPYAMFKEFYRDENNMISVYVKAPSVKHWLEQGSRLDENFFVSEKIMEVAPEFYEQLKPAMEYVYRDFKFAKDAGWLKKYGL